jgi:hypothetical protein
VWCYRLQHLQLVNPDSKAFLKNFPHTCLWYIQFTACLTCWLPWTSLISMPNTRICLLPHTWPEVFPLQMQPVFTNFSYHFLIEFVVGGFFNFLLNSHWTIITDFIELNSSIQNAFSTRAVTLHLCCTPLERVEITSYTCMQKVNFELFFTMVCF